MRNRRHVILTAAATVSAPWIARAQPEDLRSAMQRLSRMHSLQVMRKDDVVFAKAPRGSGLDAFANIKPCSKGIVALLLGVAINREEISGVTAKLGQVAPGIVPRDATSGAAGITMEDLVTLRAGPERTSGGNHGEWISFGNWLSDAMPRPMVAEAGTRMLYSTGSTHILGAALAAATGRSLLAQARERLGGPLAVEIPSWARDPQSYYLGGNEMAPRPSDMLKLAVMMRDGGRFGGAQVIPRDWITASTEPRTRSPRSGLSYGHGWFLSPSGYVLGPAYGDQVIAAHPRRNLAVAITPDPTQPARSGDTSES